MINRLLLDALRYIRDVGPIHRHVGICSNVREVLKRIGGPEINLYGSAVMYRMHQMFETWPRAAVPNAWHYPVCGRKEYDMESWVGTLWTNPRRIELLNWLIVQLENE